jgi:N6-L-threonylcarbamoyladenine synthase
MCILAIESSCDESALALFDPASGFKGEWIASQSSLQECYGGVVPDLASREHLRTLPLLLEKAMKNPCFAALTAIAVTQGPGLAPALAMGISFAQTLALAKNLPLYGVNHLRGHAFSPFISLFEEDPSRFKERLQGYLPHLGLLVSGGNTVLFQLDEALRLTLLAQTLDDAAGEALDKGARLLGLTYPGGPLVEQYALKGNPQAYAFPRALQKSLAFSFSGLKTALRYTVEKLPESETQSRLADLCASYQAAVFDQLLSKTQAVLVASPSRFKSLGLSGGVANNKTLRNLFQSLAQAATLPLLLAQPKHSGDNAGMIAFAHYLGSLSSASTACPPSGYARQLSLTAEPSLTLV